jgi:arylsulfatase A-like enzyme
LDLERRGLLDETMVVWGGEFGRTPLNEERNGSKLLGRDHHPHAFTLWMAGAGIRGGLSYGRTDDLGYRVVEDKMHVHDLQATILHALGIDAHKQSFAYQGLNQRLIGPEDGWRVHDRLFA